MLIAGIDEAGLGPLLGPLTIGVSAFEADQSLVGADFWRLMEGRVSSNPKEKKERIVVCDSKKLHSPSRGLKNLEENLLPFISAWRSRDCVWSSLEGFWKDFCLIPADSLLSYPWYADAACALPQSGHSERIAIRARTLEKALPDAGLTLKAVGSLPILAGEYNRLAEIHRSKSDINLSGMALAMLQLWDHFPEIRLYCDRLGARAYYEESLQLHLRPDRIVRVEESEEYSEYHLFRTRNGQEEHLHISFEVDADESRFPVALASMAAKYAREVCVESLNAWFGQRQPELKPTKGYVKDGRRWLSDTWELRSMEGIPDDILIRCK